MTTATRNEHDNTSAAVLFMAFELREKTGKLGFSGGHGHTPRERMLPDRAQQRVKPMGFITATPKDGRVCLRAMRV